MSGFDVSGILSNAGVALERTAKNTFGAAIRDPASLANYFKGNTAQQRSGQNPNGFTGALVPPPAGYVGPTAPPSANTPLPAQMYGQQNFQGPVQQDKGDWNTTNYAATVGSFAGNYDPKTKFLFKVKFQFNDAAMAMAASLMGGLDVHDLSRELSFIIKQIDLPTIEYEYDDINMYNFRTKVLKSIKHKALNFIFYDDTGNRALNFFNIYMKLSMPITRREYDAKFPFEDAGFEFPADINAINTSLRDAFSNNQKNLLLKLTIEQFYMDGSKGVSDIQDSVKLNSFVFTNPRILSFDISDQDHENGGLANLITSSFDFDNLFIETGNAGKNSKIDILPGEGADIDLTNSPSPAGQWPSSPQGKTGDPSVMASAASANMFNNSSILANRGDGPSTFAKQMQGANSPGGAMGAIFGLLAPVAATAKQTLLNTSAARLVTTSLPVVTFVSDKNASTQQIADLARRVKSLI